jgi:hypothetical protein
MGFCCWRLGLSKWREQAVRNTLTSLCESCSNTSNKCGEWGNLYVLGPQCLEAVAGEGLGSLASSGRGTWSSVVLAHTAILDLEMFFLDMGKCVFASQTMRAVRFGCGPVACGARPALVVTHWSNTQRRAERSPERLGSL